MSLITAAKAYANNQVAFIAWTVDEAIPDCLGFELTRIYDDGTERILAAWVPFKKQANPDWEPQDTSVWPIQKFTWRDLTVRQRRDQASMREGEIALTYRIRPLVAAAVGLEAVPVTLEKNYEGTALALAYYDGGIVTNQVKITKHFGEFQATFTSGILAGQWLTRALEKEAGENLSSKKLVESIVKHIQTPDDALRKYLAGDVLPLFREFFKRGEDIGGSLLLALYELSDKELVSLIVENKQRAKVILSTAGHDEETKAWDTTNQDARTKFVDEGVEIYHRLFNTSSRIGHNKFGVLLDADGSPLAVITGSTNWTSTGLCGQSNNAIVIDSQEIAAQFSSQWEALLEDTNQLETQGAEDTFATGNKNVQGQELRTLNATALESVGLAAGTAKVWFSPNTKRVSKGTETPPDLQEVFKLMRQAKESIFFACFMPSRQGKDSIVAKAVDLARDDRSLMVYGAISDASVLPNYRVAEDLDGDGKKDRVIQPNMFEEENIHLVLASALSSKDLIGAFEKQETSTVGRAIIHDKIVVIDPLSDTDCTVIFGSHNLGYKASYANDENLVIVRGNRALAEAYAVHVIDVWEHYRFRAVQIERREQGKETWDGFLRRDGEWQKHALTSARARLASYFARG